VCINKKCVELCLEKHWFKIATGTPKELSWERPYERTTADAENMKGERGIKAVVEITVPPLEGR